MTARQALGLYANMPRLQAQRLLDAAAEGRLQLTAEQAYDLVLEAKESEQMAEQAFRARRHAELRAGVTPR